MPALVCAFAKHALQGRILVDDVVFKCGGNVQHDQHKQEIAKDA